MSSDDESRRRTSEPSKRELRERALDKLKAGVVGLGTEPSPSGEYAMTAMLEEVRVYQAELEVQNDQLRETQSLAEAEARRFEALFDGVPVAIMVVEKFGLVSRCNPCATRLFRLDERHLRQTFLLRLVERVDNERVAAALHRLYAGEPNACPHVELRGGDGGTFIGDLHLSMIEAREEATSAPQFICTVIDQTALVREHRELVRQSTALAESRHLFAATVDASLDAIIGVDGQGRIVLFNPTAVALFACPPEVAYTTPIARFFPDAARLLAATSPTVSLEWTATTLSGRPLSVEISAVHGKGTSDVTTLFVRDSTQRKLAEEHRQVLELQLLESQKLQAVGTLAGGIAHDFNNMLGAILGNVALAKQDSSPDASTWSSLLEIEKASLRARELVHQILAFSRKETAKRERVKVSVVVDDALKLARVALPPGIELTWNGAPDLPEVLADATQLEQAVLNLCTNAIHAVQGKETGRGAIRIEAVYETPDLLTCERLGLAVRAYVAVHVHDDGVGMSEEVLQHALEPFYTTKPVGQGTGLGLAVVHGVMRTHQGAVHMQSTRGVGSTFSLFVPSAPVQAVTSLPAPAVAVSAASGAGQRILYVDDDEALLVLAKRMLSRRGYEVVTRSDPRVALDELAKDKTSFALVMTDFNMPSMSGIDLILGARAAGVELPFVLCSGYVTEEIEAAATAAGVATILHKPASNEIVYETLERLLGRSGRG